MIRAIISSVLVSPIVGRPSVIKIICLGLFESFTFLNVEVLMASRRASSIAVPPPASMFWIKSLAKLRFFLLADFRLPNSDSVSVEYLMISN